jgi:hypothetical protein
MECQQIKLPKPGPDPFNRVIFKNQRGQRYLGAAAFVGTGKNARSHMHASAGIQDIPPGFKWTPDPERLARELGVDKFNPNTGRIWTFDEGECQGGYIIEFDGVKMTWIGEMVAEDVVNHFMGPSYVPALIYRLTKWTWKEGKPAYILREPNGPTWVMQETTSDIDPTLNINNLNEVGSKLKDLPEGWTFETKVLAKDLVLDTMKGDGWASIIRDELHNTYQACGYDSDTSANYVP